MTQNSFSLNIRPRRNRRSAAIRQMVCETTLSAHNLIYPLFILSNKDSLEPIVSMPGINRMGLTHVLKEVEECLPLGVRNFILFPVVPDEWKDKYASYGCKEDNFYVEAIREIKSRFPEVSITTDVAMDPYSSDGHDGLVEDGQILNDETLPILGKMALVQAAAGADFIGPSDMMDGRVEYIRSILDKENYTSVGIMSYTAKYASAFYGPFRDALASAPKFGDKKTYQMDPANTIEALREADLDVAEGADMLMVKPAMPYLDIIQKLKETYALPVVAYQVSGEYAMIMAAGQQGWLDEESAMKESLLAIRRAGADIIISYFAKRYAILNQ